MFLFFFPLILLGTPKGNWYWQQLFIKGRGKNELITFCRGAKREAAVSRQILWRPGWAQSGLLIFDTVYSGVQKFLCCALS